MSQVTTTTTPAPVTVACSGATTTVTTLTMVPTSIRLAAALGQHDVVLLPQLIPRDIIRGVVGLATVPQ